MTFTLIVMFYLSWQITLIALALLPIIILPARFVGRRIQSITRESYNLNASMTAMMAERFNVSGALLVKLFGEPDIETRRFEDKAGRVRDIGVTRAMYTRLFMAAVLLTASLATAMTFGLGGLLAANGTLEVGTLVAMTAYLVRLYGPLTALSNVQVDIMTALVSFDRVFEVLDLKPMIAERDGRRRRARGARPRSSSSTSTSATRRPTRFRWRRSNRSPCSTRRPASRSCSTSRSRLEPGELVALVGPSGAGKTTISHLIPRLYDVRAGRGPDQRDRPARRDPGLGQGDRRGRHPGCPPVPRDDPDEPRYARPEATDEELTEALRAAHILPLIDSLPDGLDTLVGDRGYRLSGGEKQRIAIARLLLKAPDIVVLDEATAHLDSESEVAVQIGPEDGPRRPDLGRHRPPPVDGPRGGPDPGRGRPAGSSSGEPTIRCSPRAALYAELYRTQFERQEREEGVPAA